MSLLDELQKEVAEHTVVDEKRPQIEGLRDKTQAAFKDQFLQDLSKERRTYLQGRLDALNECLQLFMSDEEKAEDQERRIWKDEED